MSLTFVRTSFLVLSFMQWSWVEVEHSIVSVRFRISGSAQKYIVFIHSSGYIYEVVQTIIYSNFLSEQYHCMLYSTLSDYNSIFVFTVERAMVILHLLHFTLQCAAKQPHQSKNSHVNKSLSVINWNRSGFILNLFVLHSDIFFTK